MQHAQKIDVHGLSIPSEARDQNHDHFAIATLNKSMRVHQSNLSIDDDSRVHGHNQGHVFLVADGVSGGPAPLRASGEAVDSVVHYFLNEMPWYHLADGEPRDVLIALQEAFQNSQEELVRSAAGDASGMGTTLTLAFVSWPNLYVAHVGDSRCYLSRKGRLRQLTTDHTLAELRRGADGHPTARDEHVLWNAVGGRSNELRPEVHHETLESGDLLVLATDGVTQASSDLALKSILSSEASAEELCGRLVTGATSDDRTAIVVRFLPLEQEHAGAAQLPPTPSLDESQDQPGRREQRDAPAPTRDAFSRAG